ncbi:MAG TPA: hypothetical protein GX724_03440 [Fibrobacter sp.]|nr:hypothetical protein [Fibrobacter sp.]
MVHFNYKTPLVLGVISTVVLPLLTFCFVGLFLVRFEIGLDLFSSVYTVLDLLHAFFFLLVFIGNLILMRTLSLRMNFDGNSLSSFQYLIKANLVLFAFLVPATIAFSIAPSSLGAYTFWLSCFSIGLLLNISLGIYLMIQAKSHRKILFLWIGLAFVFAQFFDYSGFRVLAVFANDLSPTFMWDFLGISVFDYQSLDHELKRMFDEVAAVSLFFTLSLGAVIVLLRTVALAIFYVLMAQLLFLRKKPRIKK